MLVVTEQFLRMYSDTNRHGTPIQVLGCAAQRIEDVLVLAVRLGSEIIPYEALHGMVPRADVHIRYRMRDDRTKDLKSGHDIPLLLLRIRALHCESQQTRLRFCVSYNREGYGVRSANSKCLESALKLRLETHRTSLPSRWVDPNPASPIPSSWSGAAEVPPRRRRLLFSAGPTVANHHWSQSTLHGGPISLEALYLHLQ